MDYKKVLTIQDISCVGQCSLTVALPILSACGHETAILPSAVLSTHTGGFKGYTFRDLSDDIPAIQKHWQSEGISFDAIYTGYLGSIKQIAMVEDIIKTMLRQGGVSVVDPAMGDNGKLYPDFDNEYAKAMTKLCSCADVILPNITEACYMVGCPYLTEYDQSYVSELLERLSALGAKSIVLTGVSYSPDTTGVVLYENGVQQYYRHDKVSKMFHGTGDIYSSTFVGSWIKGKDKFEAVKIAADYTVACIQNTKGDDKHWYGVKFEPALSKLIELLNN